MNGSDGPESLLRTTLQSRLVESLLRIPAISSPEEQRLLLELVQQRLGELGVRDHTRPRIFFLELVMRCGRFRGGPADLLAGVQMLAGEEDPDLMEAQRLVDQLVALESVPQLARPWEALLAALNALVLEDVLPILGEVTDGRAEPLPRYCDTTWAAFVHLVVTTGPPSGPIPSWMRFLEVVRARLNDVAGRHARVLNRSLAREWGATAELERVRAAYDAQPARVPRSCVLTIVLSPVATDEDLFTLHSFQRWDDDLAPPVPSTDRQVRRGELTEVVEAVVRRADRSWATDSPDPAIEFVLPLTLINEPVEWWPKDSLYPPPTALALYHDVVVRSFERLRETAWHRVWLRRWQVLQMPGQGRVYWSPDPSREDHVHRLEADLSANEDYVALVLSRPPSADPEAAQEIMVALRAGIPLIVWHRGERTPEVRKVLTRLLSPPKHVPTAAARIRRHIERLEPAARLSHPARELSILWDNAQRAPRVG